MEFFKHAGAKYRDLVSEKQGIVEELESAFKYLSYLIAGRFEKSAIWSELANVTSNLLRLAHAEILRPSTKQNQNKDDENCHKIQQWLRIIDHIQVFLELGSYSLHGNKMKWFVIFITECIKVVMRVIIVLKYKKKIVVHPSHASAQRDDCVDVNGCRKNGHIAPDKVLLKRSGLLMRSLAASGHSSQINYNSATASETVNCNGAENIYSSTSEFSIHGELIHIIRPVIHLSTMYFFGTMSWKPFLLSLAADIASIKLVGHQSNQLDKNEKQELARRKMALMFYLLRSPFFDSISKQKILAMLRVCSNNLPLVHIICKPLMEYLPEWQKVYFYTWSS